MKKGRVDNTSPAHFRPIIAVLIICGEREGEGEEREAEGIRREEGRRGEKEENGKRPGLSALLHRFLLRHHHLVLLGHNDEDKEKQRRKK